MHWPFSFDNTGESATVPKEVDDWLKEGKTGKGPTTVHADVLLFLLASETLNSIYVFLATTGAHRCVLKEEESFCPFICLSCCSSLSHTHLRLLHVCPPRYLPLFCSLCMSDDGL